MLHDGAIEITVGVVGVTHGEEKQIERAAGTRRILRKHLLDFSSRDKSAGGEVDASKFVNAAFFDGHGIGNVNGLFGYDERIDLGYLDLNSRITLVLVEVFKCVLKADGCVLCIEAV